MAVQEYHWVILKQDTSPYRLYQNYGERSFGVSHLITNLHSAHAIVDTVMKAECRWSWTQELLL